MEKKYCPQCGSKLKDRALFCSECGYRIIKKRVVVKKKIKDIKIKAIGKVNEWIKKKSHKVAICVIVALMIFAGICYYMSYDNKKVVEEQLIENIQNDNVVESGYAFSNFDHGYGSDEYDEYHDIFYYRVYNEHTQCIFEINNTTDYDIKEAEFDIILDNEEDINGKGEISDLSSGNSQFVIVTFNDDIGEEYKTNNFFVKFNTLEISKDSVQE